MVRQTFTIRVEVLKRKQPETAIAAAASYLSYADQTDTIGYNPDYRSAEVHSISSGPIAVTFEIAIQITSDRELKDFMSELAGLSHVQAVEREGPKVPEV
jgi:hypothetical protein